MYKKEIEEEKKKTKRKEEETKEDSKEEFGSRASVQFGLMKNATSRYSASVMRNKLNIDKINRQILKKNVNERKNKEKEDENEEIHENDNN